VDQAHIDATSFLFDGRYDEADQDEEYPVIKRGYNGKKDRRKQLRGTMSTIRDGSVSVFHQAFDGNRVDTTTLIRIVESFEKIRREAEVKFVIYVGDSKLASKNNLSKLLDLNVNFVCPAERNKQIQADILSLDPESWTELAYASESELKRRKKAPEHEWNRFWGQEAEKVLELPVKGRSGERKQHCYRVIYVRSAEEERAASKNRERQMERTEKDLTRVQNGIPRYYKDSEAIRKKAQDVLAKHRTSSFYNIEIVTENGSPFLKWSHNREALDHEERTRGRYALLTNLSSEQYSMNDVLTQQKGQYRVEHRFSRWKGPIGVSPIFLKKNQRVAAMVILTALALTVFCLIEREIRKKLCDKDGYTRGFLPENRKSRPTGKTIFNAVSNIFAVVPEGEQAIGRVCNISALAGKIYEALGVDLVKIENA
jgi:transposase